MINRARIVLPLFRNQIFVFMKVQRVVIISTAVTLLLCIFLFCACNKGLSNAQSSTLQSYAQTTVVFSDSLRRIINFSNVDDYKNRPNVTMYAWAEESTSPTELALILNSFGIIDINNKENLMSLTLLYHSKKEAYTLENNLVYGILALSYIDGLIYTQVFQRQESQFEHLKHFDAQIHNLYCNTANRLAQILNGGSAEDLGYDVSIYNNKKYDVKPFKGSDTDAFQNQVNKEFSEAQF